MRPVSDWNEESILELPLGEFDWLEVKGRRALDLTIPTVEEKHVRENLSKALSAFANSGGGRLIFGLKDPKTKTSKWQVDDGGIAVTNRYGDTREWLESIIPTLVDYPLTEFNVYAVLPQDDWSQIQHGRALFVIDISDSPHAPHQAQDNRYYIRAAGRSRPVGHRLVSDIMGRRRHPKVELDFSIETIRIAFIQKTHLAIHAHNVGRVFAQHVNCRVFLPSSLTSHHISLFDKNITKIEGRTFFVLEESNTESEQYKPILPHLKHTWKWEMPRNFSPANSEHDEKILWEVYADNAPVNKGQVEVHELPLVRSKETALRVFWASVDKRQLYVYLFLFGILVVVQVFFVLF
jgi:hypothetical protein